MKFSKYNIIVKDDKEYLIYNYLTTSFVVMDEKIFQSLLKNNNPENIKIESLVKSHILVDESIDEDKIFTNYCEKVRRNDENDFNAITILTTTACNAQCYYCFERQLEPVTMNSDTANAVVKFIISNYNRYNSKKIRLRWFGGEPLVNYQIINHICESLKNHNIEFESEIITNGYLFNKELIVKAKELWNLREVQITLDGIGDNYNKIKNYKNNNINAFEQVMKNITDLLDNDITLFIRLNYNINNVTAPITVIEYLSKYNHYNNLYVCTAAIREENAAPISSFDSETSPHLTLLKHLKKNGFIRNINMILPKIKALPCEGFSPKRYFIYPNGDIYKCQHTKSDNDYKPLGNVSNGKIDKTILKQWEFKGLPPKCLKCNVSLLCQGGCKSMQDSDKIKDVDCYRYKNSLDGILRLYYKFYKEEQNNEIR